MAALLGARPRALVELDGLLRALRPGNYFQWGDLWLLVRFSRLARPFWGVDSRKLHLFRDHPYALVLLVSPQRGWLLEKNEVERRILQGRWSLARDHEYKITGPLADARRFDTVDQLRSLLGAPCGHATC